MTQFPTDSPLRWKNRRPEGRTKGWLPDERCRIEGNEAYSPTKACNESLISNSYQTLMIRLSRSALWTRSRRWMRSVDLRWMLLVLTRVRSEEKVDKIRCCSEGQFSSNYETSNKVAVTLLLSQKRTTREKNTSVGSSCVIQPAWTLQPTQVANHQAARLPA